MSSAERILDELISTTEAAELMGVHRSTVERQLTSKGTRRATPGQIVGKRIGGKWVVIRSTVPVSSPTIDGKPKGDEVAA